MITLATLAPCERVSCHVHSTGRAICGGLIKLMCGGGCACECSSFFPAKVLLDGPTCALTPKHTLWGQHAAEWVHQGVTTSQFSSHTHRHNEKKKNGNTTVPSERRCSKSSVHLYWGKYSQPHKTKRVEKGKSSAVPGFNKIKRARSSKTDCHRPEIIRSSRMSPPPPHPLESRVHNHLFFCSSQTERERERGR